MSRPEQTRGADSQGDESEIPVTSLLISPEEVKERLEQEHTRDKRRLFIGGASAAAVIGAVIVVGVQGGGQTEVQHGPTTTTNPRNAFPPQPSLPSEEKKPSPEHKAVRGDLCTQIDIAKLLTWTGEKAIAYSPDKAICNAQPQKPSAIPLRAYGRWDFPTTGSNSTGLEYMEVAVYDDILTDGSAVFQRLLGVEYPPALPTDAGGHAVAYSSANGTTVVNIPASVVDVAFTTKLVDEYHKPVAMPPLHKGQVAALPNLVSAIANG